MSSCCQLYPNWIALGPILFLIGSLANAETCLSSKSFIRYDQVAYHRRWLLGSQVILVALVSPTQAEALAITGPDSIVSYFSSFIVTWPSRQWWDWKWKLWWSWPWWPLLPIHRLSVTICKRARATPVPPLTKTSSVPGSTAKAGWWSDRYPWNTSKPIPSYTRVRAVPGYGPPWEIWK